MILQLKNNLIKTEAFAKLFDAAKIRPMPVKLLLAAVAANLCVVSFPPMALWPVAWISLVPLFFALESSTPRAAFFTGSFFGTVYAIGLAYWIYIALNTHSNAGLVTSFLFVVFVIGGFGGIYLGIFSLGANKLMQICPRGISRAISIACWWVIVEYGRAHFFTGFPWGLLGHTQCYWLQLIQICDITGVYGISFLLALTNFFVFDFLRNRPDRKVFLSAVFFALLIAIVLGYGSVQLAQFDSTADTPNHTDKISVIQCSIPQNQKWKVENQQKIINHYLSNTAKALNKGARIIIWPETVVPFYLQDRIPVEITSLFKKHNAILVLGGPRYSGTPANYSFYNSAYQITRGRIADVYDKVHLLPFGEYFPFGFIDVLKTRYAGPRQYSPGKKDTIFKSPEGRFGTLICFEAIFPERARALVEDGAEFLVNLSNDAWFGKSSAHFQHFSISVFRAIEFRRKIIRSSNTGISGFITPTGEIENKLLPYQEGFLTSDVGKNGTKTFYCTYGDAFAIICFFVFVMILAVVFSKKR